MEVSYFKLKRNKRYLHFIQGIFKMVFVTQVEKKLGCGFLVQKIYKLGIVVLYMQLVNFPNFQVWKYMDVTITSLWNGKKAILTSQISPRLFPRMFWLLEMPFVFTWKKSKCCNFRASWDDERNTFRLSF